MNAILNSPLILILAPVGFLLFGVVLLSFLWRVVVDTNKVHIVQSRKKTTSYGIGAASNVYYAIPAFIPFFGLSRIILPINNFALDLNDYKAYDKDRVPFELHVTAFFRIADTNMAAARVQSFEELRLQLEAVVKGAVRKILASHDIHEIMTNRATFGQQFTGEVASELTNWGVEPVKNMELMDIRDTGESKVIANIMAKKSSHIEMESRIEVASNNQKAKTAEIEAKRAVDISNLEAQQATGERSAEQQKAVGIADEKAQQEVKTEAAITKAKEMAVLAVDTQRKAEIARDAGIVKAEEQAVVTQKLAEGQLEKSKRDAEGVRVQGQASADVVRVQGQAKADAEKALQLAPVEAQIVLAKEIGGNAGYQTYLVSVRQIESNQIIGVAQAQALQKADVKIIANTGNASDGLNNVGDILSSLGGQKIGSMLEGLKNTPEGAKLLQHVTGSKNGASA